tara:strand:- start:34 stop:537 length:504 start_codon:yes stop_codon:yes gene_type:complete
MLAQNIDTIYKKDIIINEPIKNSILLHSNFYKLLYSNDIVTLNGIFIKFDLDNINIDSKNLKIELKDNINDKFINQLRNLEEIILDLLNIQDKVKIFKINEILKTKNFKFNLTENDINFKNNSEYIIPYENLKNSFILKISGIWETKNEYGITFKIIILNKLLKIMD